MAKFCVEPDDCYDVDGCCLALWVPCAQYGKTHWRLKQVDDGKDPSNIKWKSSDGCNGPCWAWSGLCCLLQGDCEHSSFNHADPPKKMNQIFANARCLIGILTGLQRTRIRVTYGIKGNIGSDLALSFFCRPCTLVQNDREVRAREGDLSLSTNEKTPITTRPSPVQEMRYISPRQTVSDNEPLRGYGDEENCCNDCPTPKKLHKIPKYQPRSEAIRPPLQPDEYHLAMSKAKTRELRSPEFKIGNSSGTHLFSSSHEPISLRSNKTRQDQNKLATQGSNPAHNSYHTADKRNAETLLASATTHVLANCSSKVPPKQTGSKIDNQTLFQQHALASCSAAETEELNISRSVLAGRTEFELMKTGANTSEQTIVDCENIVGFSKAATKEATNTTDTHELSYVHDFSECQIDKNILAYYEEEETRSELPNSLRQHANGKVMPGGAKSTSTGQDGRIDSIRKDTSSSEKPSKDELANPEQHTLADCTKENVIGKDKSVSPKQHALADCTQKDIFDNKMASSGQHVLADCSGEDTESKGRFPISEQYTADESTEEDSSTSQAKSIAPKQHPLVDCARDSFSKGPQLTNAKQHALADCHEEFDTLDAPRKNSRRASSPTLVSSNKQRTERQHRLASCSVPTLNQKDERATVARHMAELARMNESCDSQSTVRPFAKHALSDCAGDANSERKVPSADGQSQNDKRDSVDLKTDGPAKDNDVAGHPRKSR